MEKPPKKKLRNKIADLKMERRVGKYVPNTSNTGITKASRKEQREHRKSLTEKIRQVRASL